MVTDQEIANGVETLLRQSDPNAITTLNGVVQQLGLNLGFDLSHKAAFIRDQINLIFRSHPEPPPQQPPPHSAPNDLFALQQQHHQAPQFHNAYQNQIPSHFALIQHQHQQLQRQQQDVNFLSSVRQPHPIYPPVHQQDPPQLVPKKKVEIFDQNAAAAGVSSEIPKESAPAGTKRRGGPGGLNKLCGVSPELQAIVGEPELSRTEIVKQLWAYIRKNNLQDPSNKRKIICDEALCVLFETDSTDMFKMNKLLSKHIIPLGPTKESSKAKRLKADVRSTVENTEPTDTSPVIISEALSKFFGTGEIEMLQSEALRRVSDYIKVNLLEDPSNAMVILCDAKLQDLLGCESISALEIPEVLTRHHLFNRP